MRSAKPTIDCLPLLFALTAFLIHPVKGHAQENSPYSRYGLGDMISGNNILNRAMGGLSIPYSDLQSINFTNPASYAELKVTTLDVGLDFNSRTIRADNPLRSYTSRYLIPSYLQLGVPLKKKGYWGMNFGLRPVTRINYNLNTRTRLEGIDTVLYNYTGNGGAYQAFVGMGFGNKKLRFGLNAGYTFGNKLYSTRLIFLNDTVPYKKAYSSDTTRFGGLFVQGGLMYRTYVGGGTYLRIGANGSLQNSMKATRDISRQTFEFSPNSGTIMLDSVYYASGDEGRIVYPGSFGFGVMLEKEDKWLFGAEFNSTGWQDYRYYGQADPLRNSWVIRAGGQFIPNVSGKKYWSRVAYRGGFSYGTEPVFLERELTQYLFTAGVGLPVRRNFYTNQYTTVNVTMEVGARGNKQNPIRETLFRMALGLNLSDIWFNPRKYD